jgi:hypothetical protein
MPRRLVHAMYLGLSLLFASRFFQLTHPTSFAITEGDPALVTWTLQWVSRALLHDPRALFAGNTFFPYAHAVVLTDSMLPLAILNAPIRLFTTNPWVGYDVLVVLAYYLSCVWGGWLAREVTGSETASIWGGIFWGFLFFRVHHIGHLQMLSFQVIPAAAVALLRFWKNPGVRSAVLFAVLFVVQALVSWYLAFIMAVILAVIAVCRPWRETLAPRALRYYVLIAVVTAAAIVPVAWPYRAAFADSTLSERFALVNTFGDAVHPADFLTPPTPTLLGQLIPANRYWIWGENTLYVGFVPLLLAVFGVASYVVSAVRRTDGPAEAGRYVWTGLALVVVGYVLALGFVSPSLGIPLPLHYVARVVPMVAGLRATQRFALAIYAGVLLLSASGFCAIVRNWSSRAQAAACAVVCGLFLLEVFPFTLPVHADNVYEVSAPDRAIASYQRSRSTPLTVLHLPINYFREPYPISEATYMLDSTAHWANILNGFSGGVPQGFMDRMTTLNTLPDPVAVKLLLDLGVDVVAVHRGAVQNGALLDFFDRQPWATVSPLPNGEYVVLIEKPASPKR